MALYFHQLFKNQTSREEGSGITEGIGDLTTSQEYARGEGITGTTSQEASGSEKITLAKIRQRQKEKIKELA